MFEIVKNYLLIKYKQLLRFLIIIIINLLAVFLFSVYILPCFLMFFTKYTDISIVDSILNTFIGALIGLNTSYILLKLNFVREIYKNDLLDNYRNYKDVVDLILYCLCTAYCIRCRHA